MRLWRRHALASTLLGMCVSVGGLLAAGPAAGADPQDRVDAQVGSRELVWVFFAGDPLEADEASSQPDPRLADRARELGARTLARRAKVAGSSASWALVDARDLPLRASWVSAVEATGAQVRVHSRWLRAVSVWADAAARARIESLPFVEKVAPVVRRAKGPGASWRTPFVLPTVRTQEPPTVRTQAPPTVRGQVAPTVRDAEAHAAQLELLGADFLHGCGLTGQGVLVGVQDSGFLLDHGALGGVDVVATRDFVGDDDDVGPQMGDPESQHAHGTMVLSLLAGFEADVYSGVAPGVQVILTKTEDVSQELPFEEDLYVAGLEYIEAQGADIFTASLGYVDWYDDADLDGQTPVTSAAARLAVERGLIMLNAVGNGGPAEGGANTLVAPADAPGVLAIGSVDPRGALSSFSSWGPTADGRVKPELLAPGEDVYVVDWRANEGYLSGNGTSFATPMAAGLVALLLEAEPGLTPDEVFARLRDSADPYANPSDTQPANGYGWGRIDGQAAAPAMCACLDIDGDGVAGLGCPGEDCDDTDPQIQPGAEERCNRRDDDCDGVLGPDELDEDRDGWAACEGDCADADPTRHPGRQEHCENGIDDNCDGLVDAEDPMCEAGGQDGGSSDESGEVGTAGADGDGGATATGCACGFGADPMRRDRRGAWLWLSLLSLGLWGRSRRRRGAFGVG